MWAEQKEKRRIPLNKELSFIKVWLTLDGLGIQLFLRKWEQDIAKEILFQVS